MFQLLCSLDFANKENKFSEPFYPTEDTVSDFKFMTSFFEGVNGKIPSIPNFLSWSDIRFGHHHLLQSFPEVFQLRLFAPHLILLLCEEFSQNLKIVFQYFLILIPIVLIQNNQKVHKLVFHRHQKKLLLLHDL